MNTKYPKITVVTPVFNQVQYLEKTILSIINQGYPNLEYIIIDGGSTDGTIDVIKKYEKYLSYWVSEPDKGMYDAIQKGFDHSNGEIMCWLNSDDIFFDKCLFVISEVFENHPEIDWFTSRSATIDTDDRILGISDIEGLRFCKYDFYLNRGFWVPQSSTIWRRSLWKKIGGSLDTNLRLAGDFDLWVKFINTAPLYVVDTLIGTYRIREGQLSQMMDKYMQEAEISLAHNLLTDENDLKLLRKYEKKLRLTKSIDKLKILRGDRVVRLRHFIGINHFFPPVIKYNGLKKHF